MFLPTYTTDATVLVPHGINMEDNIIYIFPQDGQYYAVRHPESLDHIIVFTFKTKLIDECMEVSGDPIFVRYDSWDQFKHKGVGIGCLMPCPYLTLFDRSWSDPQDILGAMIDPDRQLEIEASDIKL